MNGPEITQKLQATAPDASRARESVTMAECSRGTAWIALGCLLLAWYVSISVPLLVYSQRLGVGKNVARVVFAPIGWLHDRTPLRYPLRWTARMWDPSLD
jgi:hypothetical protein